MILRRLNILNFKNITSAELEFAGGLNCFAGSNGAGKTNILDAVYYLSMTKSAFGLGDLHCIKRGSDFFMLSGEYTDGGLESRITCSFKERKVMKKDGKEYDRMRDHIGMIPVVFSTPSDVVMISDAPDERRKFINSSISQSDTEYMTALVQYNRLLLERNKALKEPDRFRDYISILDARIPCVATDIFQCRRTYISQLAPVASRIYGSISGGAEEISVTYLSDMLGSSAGEILERNADKDRRFGYTTAGVHRDDIELKICGVPARKYGSQGQQKTMLLALKLAQAEMLGKNAILLLDDVFDKLDAVRVENLIRTVTSMGFGQTFVTDSNKVRLESVLGEHRMFTVKNGEVL